MDIHNASSKSWGSEACARLCMLVVESNSGIAQMVIENRTELLDLADLEELQSPNGDDSLSTTFLAIYYDRPEIISYLRSRGIDFSKFCDPMSFGTPLFYAVSFSRVEIVELLESYGCSLEMPCNRFGQTPLDRAEKMGNKLGIKERIVHLIKRRDRVSQLFRTNCLRYLPWIRYRKIRRALLCIQRVVRGYWGRLRTKVLQKEMKEELKKQKLHDKKHRNKKVA